MISEKRRGILPEEQIVSDEHNTSDDAERLAEIREFLSPADKGTDRVFLLGLLDARDAALKDAREEIENLSADASNDGERYRAMRNLIDILRRDRAIKDEVVAAFRTVVEEATKGWEHLKEWYDGADKERSESGEIGSQHRDGFETWLDTLVEDAKEALARLDAPSNSGNGWRQDRPGWYWVKRSFEEDTWRPAQWIMIGDTKGWEGYTHPEEIVEIGPYIPGPRERNENG